MISATTRFTLDTYKESIVKIAPNLSVIMEMNWKIYKQLYTLNWMTTAKNEKLADHQGELEPCIILRRPQWDCNDKIIDLEEKNGLSRRKRRG